jgi:nicotinamide mononucleotide (NMN) deamidase PncC
LGGAANGISNGLILQSLLGNPGSSSNFGGGIVANSGGQTVNGILNSTPFNPGPIG